MTEKKISFGFKQVKKQLVLLPNKIETKNNDIELIQCLEGQSIKLINAKEEEKPLVIPLLNGQRTSAALASLKNLKNVLDGDEQNDDANGAQKPDAKPTESSETDGQLTIEQRVVRELLNEAKNTDEDNDETNGAKLSLPMAADKLPLEGAKQSTMDDYDSIPIAHFGMAMLRGMGLKDEEIIANKNKEIELRPKGMGLGADKVVKKAKLLVAPAANETLEIKKNAYIRIIGGKNKDLYGQIEGLDDHACRVIVRLALGGNRETLNEFMVQPVSKQEYLQYGKVINSAKYDEYKRKQEEMDAKRNIKQEVKREIKEEVKEEHEKSRKSVSRERDESKSRSYRESNPRRSREKGEKSERIDYGSSSRRRERSRERSRDRSKRSSSYDRNRCKDIERNSTKNRYESRRSRSVDKYNHKPSSSSRRDRSREHSMERPRDDKSRRRGERSKSSSIISVSDSDSSDDSRHDQRSHHKKSKKKHKKKSSKKYDSSDNDDRSYKKKTKKSKRERSRSRGRR
ncbi:G-patch domain and KOW motifs-containing protein [Sitodiplosis mosellana]|uniref:G-patch domain and KOW motifs-containing protein n=1 Tax=Sitodiplosis mosellana TaxID=263140 RepID=UPI002445238B|nr:G-patch domain and KOW motifs-containing protein [Sitodiplosis mosellana]